MKYSDESLETINNAFEDNREILKSLRDKIMLYNINIRNETAREYLIHGVLRRIDILNKCIEKVFEEFPPETEKLLDMDKVIEMDIYLHAFLINVYGVTENLALLITYEKNLFNTDVLNKKQLKEVGFFKKEFQKKLSKVIINYFSDKDINNWYNEYEKNYRDALAHRIPPYIPPMELNKEEIEEKEILEKEIAKFKYNGNNSDEFIEMLHKTWAIGSPAMYFLHSISEKSNRVILHSQMLSDILTINEMICFVINNIDN